MLIDCNTQLVLIAQVQQMLVLCRDRKVKGIFIVAQKFTILRKCPCKAQFELFCQTAPVANECGT